MGENTLSRDLTSTTVLVSRAFKLSLIAFTNSCGVLGLDALLKKNDIIQSDLFDQSIDQNSKFSLTIYIYMADEGE